LYGFDSADSLPDSCPADADEDNSWGWDGLKWVPFFSNYFPEPSNSNAVFPL
jgi:hypothetical protein